MRCSKRWPAGGRRPDRAQDSIGEIAATLEGEAREWRTLGPDGTGTDYNTRLEVFGPMQTVSVTGFPPGEVTTRGGSLQITFPVMSGAREALGQEVIYVPEGMTRMWASPKGEDLITLERFEVAGRGGDVADRIAGRVCLKESLFADPDPYRCKTIEGSIRYTLPPPVD